MGKPALTPERRAEIRRNIMDSQAWFEAEVSKAVSDVFPRLAREPMPFYLHHKLGGLAFFAEMEGTPEGWTLSDPRGEHRFKTQPQLRAWVYAIARGLPCLPEDWND
jgi:hypothetical protein